MHYPIFKSIVNTVQTQLDKRGIQSNKFKTWEDSKINAIGLELEVNLSKNSSFVHALSINFDWDSFRETQVARSLDGMHEHPFLKIEKLAEVEVSPTIDIEMTWLFDIDACQPQQSGQEGNYRINQASKWMEAISKQINQLLKNENLITRWHIEIEGDEHGKYLSAIHLISYFQYELSSARDLNELQNYVGRRLQELLVKGNRVISMAEDILKESVAA
jgi:hypothetical protein